MALRAYTSEKGQKLARNGGNHKIAHYEAKWDFKVTKIPSWVLILICYLRKSARSIFLPTVRLHEPTRAKPKHKIGPNGVRNTKSTIMKPNEI